MSESPYLLTHLLSTALQTWNMSRLSQSAPLLWNLEQGPQTCQSLPGTPVRIRVKECVFFTKRSLVQTQRGWKRGCRFRTPAECREEGWCVPMIFSTCPNRQWVHEWSRGKLLPSETRSTKISIITFWYQVLRAVSALPSWRLGL